jgi:hypothetical protein
MDLNQALNLSNCNINLNRYKDYRDVETKHFDLNRNFGDRTFDINPMNIKYDMNPGNSHLTQTRSPYQELVPLWPAPNHAQGNPPQALPEMIGQSLLTNQSYFPSPVAMRQPHGEMSSSFLQMKQAQEIQSLQDKSDTNPVTLDRLKADQAREIQQNLQRQQNFGSGPSGIDNLGNNQYARTTSNAVVNQTCAYNAQGETVNDGKSLFQERTNKYRMLKQMSPEMLNKMYGRQSDQSVLSASNYVADGDIYDQTSCFKGPKEFTQKSHDQLRDQLQQRQTAIMSQKQKQGIQSYTSLDQAPSLDEVFSSR